MRNRIGIFVIAVVITIWTITYCIISAAPAHAAPMTCRNAFMVNLFATSGEELDLSEAFGKKQMTIVDWDCRVNGVSVIRNRADSPREIRYVHDFMKSYANYEDHGLFCRKGDKAITFEYSRRVKLIPPRALERYNAWAERYAKRNNCKIY